MNYIQFSNKVVPAKKWYEKGDGLVAPHRFRDFDKECNRRKQRREINSLIRLKTKISNLINIEFIN